MSALCDCVFNAIKAGTKKIEGRAPTEHNKDIPFDKLSSKDKIIFKNEETGEEMLVKIISLGFAMDKGSYLRDRWNILDFCIVFSSLIDMSLSTINLPFIKVIRLLRILRPLRFISHNKDLKLIVVALLESINSIINIVMVIAVVFLIFAIIGVS